MSSSFHPGSLSDEAWQAAFRILESAQHLPLAQRRRFAESITSDPAVLQLVFDVLAEESDDIPGGAASSLPRPGDRIGRYEITGKLGSGGIGHVFSARDLDLDRLVALKFLSSDFLALPGAVDQLLREAKAASALNHANIVTVYEIVRSGTQAAIAMELVDGASLREFCASPQELPRVLEWGRQVASALAVAHDKDIVHRDIKPENVMVRADDTAKILDFGMARRIVAGSQTQSDFQHGGTLQYFSPEQARGEQALPFSDIFSLGTVLYELATGRHPFAGDSPLATLHRIGHENPVPPSRLNSAIPKSLDRLILAMLAKVADQRPRAAAVAAALSRELGYRQSRQTMRRMSGIALAALAVAAIAIGWFVWHRAASRELIVRQITVQLPDNRVTTGTISPDGTHLAYATVDGIFLETLANSETHLLHSPPDFWVTRIRWFKEGRKFLAGGFSRTSLRPSIWIVSTGDVMPVLFREDSYDPELSRDEKQVAFTNATRNEAWVSDRNGSGARRILSATDRLLYVLLWSGDSSHVALAHRPAAGELDPTAESGRFGLTEGGSGFESIDVATGKVDVETTALDTRSAWPVRLASMLFIGPDPDNRAAGSDLWQVESDFHTARPIGLPRRLPLKPDWIRDVSASADAGIVTMLHLRSAPTVYIGDYSSSGPAIANVRHLTLDASSSFPHSWTADSRSVLFESDRRGTNDLFRQNIDSRLAEPLVATALEDFQANLAPDGKTVLFIQSPVGQMLPASIWRVPANGGRPEPVIASGGVDEFRCPLPGGKRCVARTTEGHETFTFWELDPYHGLGRKLAHAKWERNIYGDWALSPDGAEIAIPSHELEKSRIRLIAVDAPGGPVETEIPVATQVSIAGLNWTADGKGWFAPITTSGGSKLVFIDRQGRVTSLLERAGYTIPSPDGKRVALTIPAVTSNIWAVDWR